MTDMRVVGFQHGKREEIAKTGRKGIPKKRRNSKREEGIPKRGRNSKERKKFQREEEKTENIHCTIS